MMSDQEPLAQFQAWYRQARAQGLLGDPINSATAKSSQYNLLKLAFYAAWAQRGPQAGPTAAADAVLKLETYSPEREEPYRASQGFMPAPNVMGYQPDYAQYGTVTGRIPRYDVPGQAPYGPPPVTRIDDYTRVEPQGVSAPGLPDGDPALAHRQAQLYVETKAMPAITADTAGFPLPGPLKHVTTVWDGDKPGPGYDLEARTRPPQEPAWEMYGASGPVPTPLSVQEDADASS
jgi:hypothetical protein